MTASAASGCVRAGVVDAYSLGFDAMVAEEGVFDPARAAHRDNLFATAMKYADVVSTRLIQNDLLSVTSA